MLKKIYLSFSLQDQFQRDFFFIRSAEYQTYVNQLGPGVVTQGDLTDAYYFDFISFAQYATISRDTSGDPPLVFEEQQPAEDQENADSSAQRFVSKVIRRKPEYSDNSLLPVKHGEIVGSLILQKLEDTFGNTTSSIPPLPTYDTLKNDNDQFSKRLSVSLKQLVNLFIINGFAWDGSVIVEKNKANQIVIAMTLSSPATYWSGQALKLRKAKPVNDFLMKTAKVLLNNSGYKILSSSTEYTNNQEINKIILG